MGGDRQLLTDIRLQLQHSELRPVYVVATDQRRISADTNVLTDIGKISGSDNLVQAVILRLLTPQGELTELAHPNYGSRLHELIGQQNTPTTRNLMKLFILQSLKQEPRIEKVEEVAVTPIDGSRTREDVRHRVNVLIRVKPIGETSSVTIGPFVLELGQ
jgi:phage baseplate assembly protein W